MKQSVLLFFLFILYSCNTKSSNSSNFADSSIIRSQAMEMSEALVKRNAKLFIEFHYPKVIEMIGSKEKAIVRIIDTWKEGDRDSIFLIKNTIGNPSKIIKYKDELQCTIPQSFEYKSKDSRVMVKSTLIAISLDDGKKWYFVDVFGENIKKIKSILPNLSKELVIPEQVDPEVIKD